MSESHRFLERKHRLVMVGQGLPTLPPTTEPDVRLCRSYASGRIRLLSNRAIVIGTTDGDCSPWSLGLCTFRSRWAMQASHRIRLSVRLRVCLKHDFCQSPDLPGYPPHVSISPALPGALASWGILLRRGLRPGRLLPHSGESHGGFPRSVYPFDVTVGGCFTPDSCWGTTWADVLPSPGITSLLGQPLSQRRLVLPNDASMHLHLRSP